MTVEDDQQRAGLAEMLRNRPPGTPDELAAHRDEWGIPRAKHARHQNGTAFNGSAVGEPEDATLPSSLTARARPGAHRRPDPVSLDLPVTRKKTTGSPPWLEATQPTSDIRVLYKQGPQRG